MANVSSETRLGLFPITKNENSECRGHVIFIHGLMGHPIKTWYPNENDFKNNKNKNIEQYKDIEIDINSQLFWDNYLPQLEFWPNWLQKHRTDLKIWSYGYSADFREKNGSRSLSILETGKILRKRVTNNKLAEKPIIFISYSLGGLIVKEMLQDAFNNDKEIINTPKAVIFLATPHSTPSLVKLINNFEQLPVSRPFIKIAEMIIKPADYVNALRNEQDVLTKTNEFYIKQYSELNTVTEAFYETDLMNGSFIIDQDGANPGVPDVSVLPAENTNHQTITKPVSWNKNSLVQETILALIDRVISFNTNPQPDPDPPTPITKEETSKRYSRRSLIELSERIEDDWELVANYLNISRTKQRGFDRGKEITNIWNILMASNRLNELETAFEAVNRKDLIQYLIFETENPQQPL